MLTTPNCWCATNHTTSEAGLPCEDLEYNSLTTTGSPDSSGNVTIIPDDQRCPSGAIRILWTPLGCATSWLVRVVPITDTPTAGIGSITPGQGSNGPASPFGTFDPSVCTLTNQSSCKAFLWLPGQSIFSELDLVADFTTLVSNSLGLAGTNASFQVPSGTSQNYLYRAYSGGFADGTEFSNVWNGQYSDGKVLWSTALAENIGESVMEGIDIAGVLPNTETSCIFANVGQLNTVTEIANSLATSNFDTADDFQQVLQYDFNSFVNSATSAAETCGADNAVKSLSTVAGTASKFIPGVGLVIQILQAGSNVGQILQRTYELGVEASPVETAFISVNSPLTHPTRILASCSSNTMVTGQSQQCSVQAYDSLGNTIPSAQSSFSWTSSSQVVKATGTDAVGATIQVTALRPGTTTLTVTAARDTHGPLVQSSVKLTVTASTLAKIVVTPSALTAPTGQSYQLVAQGLDSGNHAVSLGTTNWVSSNNAVATVSTSPNGAQFGQLQTLASGTTTITATSGGIQGTATVTVNSSTGGGGGSIFPGQVLSATLSASAPAGHCNFGAPSNRYLLDLSGLSGSTLVTVSASSAAFDSFVCILNASNTLIAQDDDSAGNLNSTTTVSLAPGQYFLEISSFGGSGSGPYSLSASVPTITSPGSFTLGAQVTGNLSSAATKGFCNGSAPSDRWTFTLTAPGSITIDVASTAFDTYVCLLNSSNNYLNGNADSGPGTNSRLIYNNLGVGTYYIEVSSSSPSYAGGAYTLSLQPGLPPGKPILVASTVAGGLQPMAANGQCNGAAPSDRWAFTLTSPSTVTIDLASTAFDTYVCLLNSTNNYMNGDADSGPGTNSRLTYSNLGVGTYYIEVSSSSPSYAGGAYTLSLQPGYPPGTPISLGNAQSGTLSSTTANGQCNGAAPSDRWTFTLTSPSTVTIDVASTAFDTYVCLLNSTNNYMNGDADSGPGTNSRLIYSNLQVGTYYIEVSSSSQGYAGGAYTLSLRPGLPPGTPINLGSTLSGNLSTTAANSRCNGAAPADRWTFTLATSTTVTINVSSTAFDTYVCLLDANNNYINGDDNSGGGTNSQLTAILGLSTYYIEVSSRSSGGGTYTISLH